MIQVHWFAGRTADQRRELVAVLTREISRIGVCEPDSVDVVFVDVEKTHWAHAGTLYNDGPTPVAEEPVGG